MTSHGDGQSLAVHATLAEALADMLEAQQSSCVTHVSLAPQWYRVDPAPTFGPSKTCKICQSPSKDLIESQLKAGHSVLCVSWHLRRINQLKMWDRLANHWWKHMGMDRAPSWGVGRVELATVGQKPRIVFLDVDRTSGWRYTPYPPVAVQHRTSQSVVLIRGRIGAGKSELARTYALTHRHVEADQFFYTHDGWFFFNDRYKTHAHAWCEAMAMSSLRQGESVVVANTFLDEADMFPYIHYATTHGISIHVIDIVCCDMTPPRNVDARLFRRIASQHFPISRSVLPPSPLLTYEQRFAAESVPTVPDVPYLCQPGVCELGQGRH